MEGPETRRRSRSNTPFLRSHCDHENCGEEGHEHTHEHKRRSGGKKSPTINTIQEETESFKATEKREEQMLPKPDVQVVERKTVTVRQTTRTLGSAADGNKLTSTTTKTVTSNSNAGNQTKELIQNEINRSIDLNSAKLGVTRQQNHTSEHHSSSEDANGHLAYKIYKAAGEYWNKYPKTDYTYSEVSPHRREIAPGFINMPNMSRSALEKHGERVDYMVQSNPERAAYIRSRYEKVTANRYNTSSAAETVRTKKLDFENSYDSTDEVDISEFNGKSKHLDDYSSYSSKYHHESIVTRIFKSIYTVFYTSAVWCTNIFRSSDNSRYRYRRHQEQQGFIYRSWSTTKSVFLGLFQRLYLMISSILVADTWLLSSKRSRNNKWFLILLLLLLPLLLLTGAYTIFSIPKFPQPFIDAESYENFKNVLIEKSGSVQGFAADGFDSLKVFSGNLKIVLVDFWKVNFN